MAHRQKYEHRFYRSWLAGEHRNRAEIRIEESDLLILWAPGDNDDRLADAALASLRRARQSISAKIHRSPDFGRTLSPVAPEEADPDIVRTMTAAAAGWGVGPMAAVAGVIAETVARDLAPLTTAIMIENGGDVYAISDIPVRFRLYAGEASPFKEALCFETPCEQGVAVCTSSGRVGPSLSFGDADAVVAIHPDGAIADAAATAIANRIRRPADVDAAVEAVGAEGTLRGVIACMDDRLGMWGDISLVENDPAAAPEGGTPKG